MSEKIIVQLLVASKEAEETIDHVEDIVLAVVNKNTGKYDRFLISVDEQGGSYHILLSQHNGERYVGRVSVRENIDTIGEDK